MKTPWTTEEENFVRQADGKMTPIEVAKHLDRTRGSVVNKAKRLNVVLLNSKVPWTKDELDFLKENNKKMFPEEIAQHLGRTRVAVCQRAKLEGVGLYKQRAGGLRDKVGDDFVRWTPDEDRMLWDLSERFTLQQIADKLDNRTRGAVFNRCKKLGISLRQGKLTNLLIAEKLGFKKGVFHKYKKLCGMTFLTMKNPKNPTRNQLHRIIEKISSNEHAYLRFSRARVARAIEELPL